MSTLLVAGHAVLHSVAWLFTSMVVLCAVQDPLNFMYSFLLILEI